LLRIGSILVAERDLVGFIRQIRDNGLRVEQDDQSSDGRVAPKVVCNTEVVTRVDGVAARSRPHGTAQW
jgi:hypothetical protein